MRFGFRSFAAARVAAFVAVLLCGGAAFAQVTAVPPTGSAGGGGGGGGTTVDPDDGSISTAQTNDNANALVNVYDGSVWRRLTLGQAPMATSLPVTFASNQTALPASQSGTWSTRTLDGSGNAITSSTAGATRPIDIIVRDTSGNAITAFGGSGGTAQNDNTAFTAGTTSATPIEGFYQATPTNATDGRAAAVGITQKRALRTSLEDASGTPITGIAKGTAGTSALDVLTIQGAAGMVPVDQNLKFNGTAAAVGAGTAASAGVQRVTIADDDANLAAIATSTASTAANSATSAGAITSGKVQVNVAQIGGVAPSAELSFDFDTSAGTQTRAAIGLAVPASGGAVQVGGDATNGLDVDVTRVKPDGTNTMPSMDAPSRAAYFQMTNGTLTRALDPCEVQTKSRTAISQTQDSVVIPAAASKKNYICSMVVVVGAAEILNIVEGTGTLCGTGTTAIMGSTTEANGVPFAANGGFVAVGGNATTIPGSGTNVDTCLMINGSNRASGFVTWVQQ
jgi:hypothetical protein